MSLKHLSSDIIWHAAAMKHRWREQRDATVDWDGDKPINTDNIDWSGKEPILVKVNEGEKMDVRLDTKADLIHSVAGWMLFWLIWHYCIQSFTI